jgi:hypothetical protein
LEFPEVGDGGDDTHLEAEAYLERCRGLLFDETEVNESTKASKSLSRRNDHITSVISR